MTNFEKIEAYLEGWMAAQERAAFEKELETDAALYKDFEDWVAADKILKSNFSKDEGVEKLGQTLKPFTLQYFKAEENKKARVVSIKKYLIAAIAAAAIFIIYLSLPTGIDSYDMPNMPQAVVRGAEELSNKGAQLFNDGKYDMSLPLLKKQALDNPEDATANFFYGVALVKVKDYGAALPVLENLANRSSAYKEEAAFFTALSAYKLDKKQTAIKYAKLVSAQNSYFENAQRVIKKAE